ncbi:MAG: hypothetical protein R2806_10735 [Saprospiraceae bacterium]
MNLIDYLITSALHVSSNRCERFGISNPFQDALTVDYQLLQPQTVLTVY